MGDDSGQAPLDEEAVPVLAGALERAAAKAFLLSNRTGQAARKNLFGLSMSALGGCTRQAAFRLAGTAPSDPDLAVSEAREAGLGTWTHEGFLPNLAQVLYEARCEMPVTLAVDGEEIHGTTDLYSRAMGGGVLDLKTVGAHKTGGISRSGVRFSHRMQVLGYALAVQQAGQPVAWVAWCYMERGSGDVVVLLEPFGPEQAEEVRQRVRDLRRHAEAPQHAPRTERGPGLSPVCDGCPWLRECWGPEARPGDSGALVVRSEEDISFAAVKYLELREKKKVIEQEMEVYGAMVGDAPQAVYGGATITYGRSTEVLDAKEAVEVLRLHGIKPPMRVRSGARYIRWSRTA